MGGNELGANFSNEDVPFTIQFHLINLFFLKVGIYKDNQGLANKKKVEKLGTGTIDIANKPDKPGIHTGSRNAEKADKSNIDIGRTNIEEVDKPGIGKNRTDVKEVDKPGTGIDIGRTDIEKVDELGISINRVNIEKLDKLSISILVEDLSIGDEPQKLLAKR